MSTVDQTAVDFLAIAEAMIARYNAGDADGYVAFMTEDASEANYRGDVLREGKEGTRVGLKAVFADFPGNRVEIKSRKSLGDRVVLEELVSRGVKRGESSPVEPFTVLAIYSFEGDKCSRVEFIR